MLPKLATKPLVFLSVFKGACVNLCCCRPHDQIRRASSVSSRSINAQAGFWIRIGMLCEMNPTLSFNEVMAAEMRAAGLVVPPRMADAS